MIKMRGQESVRKSPEIACKLPAVFADGSHL